jgi:hypothetical protein
MAIAEYQSRGWLGRALVVGRGRAGTLQFNQALAEHQQRIQRLLVSD